MDIKELVLTKLEDNHNNYINLVQIYEQKRGQRIKDIPQLIEQAKLQMQIEITRIPEKIDKAESKLLMATLTNDEDRQWRQKDAIQRIENTEKIWQDKIDREIPQSYMQWDDDIRHNNRAAEDLAKIINHIYEIDFTTEDIPPGCLSSYFTYCNRYKFWYTNDIFKYDEEQIIQIVMCEYFNSMQDYFVKGKFSSNGETFQGISLLLMRHVGVIKEEVPYAQSVRSKLVRLVKKKYPNSKTISFPPNNSAACHLFQTMIYDDPEQRIARIEKQPKFFESDSFECFYCAPFYYFPRQYGLTLMNENTGQYSYDRDTYFVYLNNKQPVTGNSKMVREYNDWAMRHGYMKKSG